MRVNNGLTPQELEAYGISDVHDIVYNPSYDLLYQEELDPSLTGYERGVLTNLGAVAVDTGIFTGRSPKDKYIVRDDTTRDTFWWADKGKGKNDNKPLSPETWQHLKGLVTKQLSGKRLFVVDAFCGANPDTRLSVRFITEVAWQAHFVKNMFIRPSDEELAGFKPDFIVMNGAKCTNPQWKEQGLNSENFVAFNLTERMQLIGGTWYGGEMKKGMFSMMNYLLPLKGIASMHCSANVGEKGDVAVFFGLSGTGKTTLSTDPKRRLIGDDEHGWCGHICPVGALYGVLGSKGVITVAATDRQKCNRCMDCFHVCPEPHVLRAPVLDEQSPVQVTSRDCMTCGRCVDVCSEDVFTITTRWSSGAKS